MIFAQFQTECIYKFGSKTKKQKINAAVNDVKYMTSDAAGEQEK